MRTVVELDGLVKTFGTHRAVDGLSFEVAPGTIFGLLGRNGAGKTTTLRMIMDIIRPDEGRLRVFDGTATERDRSRIGYLPEERGLYPKMKVLEMLQFLGSIRGLSPGEARRAARPWLERLELASWASKKVEELSKGMHQKLQFIAAVLNRPDLLILDEPFSGMDPVNQSVFKDLILELNAAGTTIIFSTHVMDSAEKLCREIALIDRGRVVLEGPLAAVKRRFGENTVQMEFEGDGEFLERLPGVERLDRYEQFVECHLRPDADPHSVLSAAVPRLRIRRFEIVSPTLHDIFVQQVGPEAADA